LKFGILLSCHPPQVRQLEIALARPLVNFHQKQKLCQENFYLLRRVFVIILGYKTGTNKIVKWNSVQKTKLKFNQTWSLLEAQRSQKQRSLVDAQDEIDRQREQLISDIEVKLQQLVSQTRLFSIRWRLI
jgi:hypothetical protein